MEETTGHFNKLSPAEAERLAFLLEECGEVCHKVGKILRHGYESHNPLDLGSLSNREDLETEIGDVMAIIGVMANCMDINPDAVKMHCKSKIDRLKEFSHHQQ